jgi:NCAIR mutase (PurE)-related protein
VRAGSVSPERAAEELAQLPFLDVSGARVDTHRELRQGLPEIIFGAGKTPETLAAVARGLRDASQPALATRVDPALAEATLAIFPGGLYDAASRTLWWGEAEVAVTGSGTVLVVSAGSADAPVVAEAAMVARRLGNKVDCLEDLGVAGLHRLLDRLSQLRAARVVIVVAGMEGALPSVVGGLVERPVIAVPTSTGYGASLGGVTALLGMLSSCASNVSVVNIDNGTGAAVVATLINRDA